MVLASHPRYIARHEDLDLAAPSRGAQASQRGRASAPGRGDAVLVHRRSRRGTNPRPGAGGGVREARSRFSGDGAPLGKLPSGRGGRRRFAPPPRGRPQKSQAAQEGAEGALRYRVGFTGEAKKDLDRLYDFLLAKDLERAAEAVDAIDQALKLLERFPFSCRKAADGKRGPFLRELVVSFGSSGYVLLFEIE